jgi:hypothetical protein
MWFFINCLTLDKLLSCKTWSFLWRECSFTPPIKASKATVSNNFFILSISSLNLHKYAHVDSFLWWATLKSYMEFLSTGMLVLKCVTSFAQRSLNHSIELVPSCYTKHVQTLYRLQGVSCILSHDLGWLTLSYCAYFIHVLLGWSSHYSYTCINYTRLCFLNIIFFYKDI